MREANARGCEQGIETANILQLPLTRDQYSKHTVELGLQYYRNLMGAER